MSPSHHYKTSVKLLTGLKLQTISIIFLLLESLAVASERRMLTKLHLIMDNDVLIRHRSMFMTRFISPRCTTSHFCLEPLNSSLGVSGTRCQTGPGLLPPSAHIYQLFITYLQSCTTDIYN